MLRCLGLLILRLIAWRRASSWSTCSTADGVQLLPELPILLLQRGDLQLQVLLLMTEEGGSSSKNLTLF